MSLSFNKILICIDGNMSSLAAAKKGLMLVQQLSAKVALIFVIDPSLAIGNPDAGISTEQELIILKKKAEKILDELAQMYNGLDLIKLMPEGLPPKEIMKAAVIWQADLIVIGLRNHTGLLRLLSGNVGQFISRHLKIPVMIVPQNKLL